MVTVLLSELQNLNTQGRHKFQRNLEVASGDTSQKSKPRQPTTRISSSQILLSTALAMRSINLQGKIRHLRPDQNLRATQLTRKSSAQRSSSIPRSSMPPTRHRLQIRIKPKDQRSKKPLLTMTALNLRNRNHSSIKARTWQVNLRKRPNDQLSLGKAPMQTSLKISLCKLGINTPQPTTKETQAKAHCQDSKDLQLTKLTTLPTESTK